MRCTRAPFGALSSSTIVSPSRNRLERTMTVLSSRLLTMQRMLPSQRGSTYTSLPSEPAVHCSPAPTRKRIVTGSFRMSCTTKASPTCAMFCECRPTPYSAALAAAHILASSPTFSMNSSGSPVTRVHSQEPLKSTVVKSSVMVCLCDGEATPPMVSAVVLPSVSRSSDCDFSCTRSLYLNDRKVSLGAISSKSRASQCLA
mmetsp:Transcript_21078/g.63354  ORF Transcript_21078/g.63354 Transcript_21078/m.63354 type:complete len:201 (-) Transcript_21078:80-682(-)